MYDREMETRRQNLLVEYVDGSRQWIKNTTQKEACSIKGFKRVCASSEANLNVGTFRWKVGDKSQFVLVRLPPYGVNEQELAG